MSVDAAGTSPGKGDSDGDRIADDLETVLADPAAWERVDVIVQGATPGQARRAAGSFVADHSYSIIPAFSGSVTAGQVTALSRIPGVTRIELDGVAQATDAAGDSDYGVDAARAAVTPTDGTLDGSGVGICVIDTGIDPHTSSSPAGSWDGRTGSTGAPALMTITATARTWPPSRPATGRVRPWRPTTAASPGQRPRIPRRCAESGVLPAVTRITPPAAGE